MSNEYLVFVTLKLFILIVSSRCDIVLNNSFVQFSDAQIIILFTVFNVKVSFIQTELLPIRWVIIEKKVHAHFPKE